MENAIVPMIETKKVTHIHIWDGGLWVA